MSATAKAPVPPPGSVQLSRREIIGRVVLVLLLLFIFLVGIKGLGGGFKALGKEYLDLFFNVASNPFIGLMIGVLGTTLVQSSSVTTSMIVALVAAPDNPLPVAAAVPMIMGANIGTTITNTVVSLAHMGRADEFKRAFSAATCHDFFNFMTVLVLLPLELATGFLQRLSGTLAGSLSLGGGGPGKLPNPLKAALKAVLEPIQGLLFGASDNPRVGAVLLLIFSGAVIFLSLFGIVKTLRALTAARMERYITRFLDKNAYLGIVVGIVVTVMVQSSSITTSVLVPLAGAGVVTLAQVFPITLGANVGTTVTALLASLAAPEETAQFAVQIALVHLFFNIAGILMIYPWEKTRQIPLKAAEWLAARAVESKRWALIYVVALFYGLPGLMIAVWRLI